MLLAFIVVILISPLRVALGLTSESLDKGSVERLESSVVRVDYEDYLGRGEAVTKYYDAFDDIAFPTSSLIGDDDMGPWKITLLADVSSHRRFSLYKPDVSLDFAGCTITVLPATSDTYKTFPFLWVFGDELAGRTPTLTLTDSVGGGGITSTVADSLLGNSAGHIIVNGGTYSQQGGSGLVVSYTSCIDNSLLDGIFINTAANGVVLDLWHGSTTIAGGTYKGLMSNLTSIEKKVSISGGTFTDKRGVANLLASGKGLKTNADGTVSVVDVKDSDDGESDIPYEERISLDAARISAAKTPYPYIVGDPFDPDLSVSITTRTTDYTDGISIKVSTIRLTRGVDYTQAASIDETGANAMITIQGIGRYKGSITASLDLERQHRVTFVDGVDQKEIISYVLKEGSSALAPIEPFHPGYRFKGWDKDYSFVTSSLTVTALYEKEAARTVTFVDGITNDVISSQEVEYGGNAIPPLAPDHDGYSFAEWEGSYIWVTSDVTVRATYRETEGGGLLPDEGQEEDRQEDLISLYPENRDYWVDKGDGTEAGAQWYVYRKGEMRTNCWVELDGEWYYLGPEGEMKVGRYYDANDGNNYYLNPYHDGTYGKMSHGWLWADTEKCWVYCNEDHDGTFGRIMTGWLLFNGDWYYLRKQNGAMIEDVWIEGYYLTHGGKMARNQWVGEVWVGDDGKAVRG